MREMKDSGFKWIGLIPSAWNLKKLKYMVTKAERGTAPDYTDNEGTKVVNQATFSRGYFDTNNIRFSKKPAFISRGLLFPNDILLASTGGGVLGKTYYYEQEEEYVADSHVTIIRTCTEILMSKFLYYFFAINYDTFNAMMSEGSTNQTELQRDLLINMCVPVPSSEEQSKIIAFLNGKCAKIDSLMSDIQAQIDLLEQYKRSAITEAVTKGLNLDAKIKDSGIPWCPVIPSHWIVTNPKALFYLRNQRAMDGDRQLTASQKFGIVFQDEFMEMENQKVVTVEKDFGILKHVEPNDFVISMRSFQGGLEYSEQRGCISSAYVMLTPNKDKVYPPFFRWFFKSSKYINALQSTTNLVRDGQAMRYANFVQVPLFIIPMEEQAQIADYLNQRVSQIEAVLSDKREQLATLDEYKKSLIYEYVTGKREVIS